MIQEEEEVDPLLRISLQNFSYSRLTTYKTCPLKYFYKYVLKEDETFGPAATLGNIVHKALEITLEKDEPVKAFELLNNYKGAINEFPPVPAEYIDNGHNMLLEFVDRHSGEKMPIHAKEHKFTVVVAGARFTGYIDRIDLEGDDMVRIIDYKSGARQIPDSEVATDLQLGLYALVAQRLFPDRKVYAELYYLKTGKRKGHLFTTGDLLDVEERLSLLVSEILNVTDFKATPENSPCYWCDFAKNGVCATGARRISRRK